MTAEKPVTSSWGLSSVSEGCGASDAGLRLPGLEKASSSCVKGIPSKRSLIKQLAERIHQPKSKYRVLALLTAYFDESGIHQNSPVTVIGGFLAPSEVWEQIETAWQSHLDYFRVEYFHMAALEDGFEPLDKLRRELRYALYDNLISVLLSHKPVPIASAIINDDWNNFDRSSPQAQLLFGRYPEPYDYCFDHLSQFLITHSQKNYGGEPIALIFSEQLEYQSRALFVYNAFKKHPYWADKFISLTFAPMKKFPALQSADVMAYDTYQKMLEYVRTKKLPAIDGLVKKFFDNGMQPYASYTDAEGLRKVVAQPPKWIVAL